MNRRTQQLINGAADQAVTEAVTASALFRVGEVTAVDTGAKTLTATVDGVTLRGIPYMKSYSAPTAGDVVWLLHQNSILVALGAY